MNVAAQNNIDNITIAIVEDDKTVRDGLQMLLDGSQGFTVVGTYSNGEEALDKLVEKKPDVVLMDINLPGINGIEVISTLKDAEHSMLFIMLTVFEDTDAIFTSLSAGASGYLLKSTSPSRLIESIREVFTGGSPMSSEIARKVVESFKQSPEEPSEETFGLTKREEEVLSYLSKGFMYKEIAELMFISIDTVRSHIRHIYDKLHVKTRTEAILIYLQK